MNQRQAAVWAVRLLLAALFIFGGEVLLWSSIQQNTALDWAIRIIGYTALAVLVLDFTIRYRIREIYDVMVLFAIYGLLVSLLVTPVVSFARFPYSLLTRVLGGQTLLGFEMWGFFLVLTAGNNVRYRRLLLATALWLGFYWGIWMRWTPEFGTLFGVVELKTMFLYAGGFFSAAMVLYALFARISTRVTAEDLRLPGWQLGLLVVILIAFYVYQSVVQHVTVWMLLVVALLVLLNWSILWFRHEPTGDALIEQHLPVGALLGPVWLVLMIICFVGATLLAFNLPLAGTREVNQFWLMEMGFGGVGSLWMPLVLSVLAMRGLDYQMRTNQVS